MEGINIKTLYLIRHAKSDWSEKDLNDYERGLKKRGIKDLDTISSYMSLRHIKPDIILSSSALRAQITADTLAQKINYINQVHYMEELYMTRPETLLNILHLQDDQYNKIFLIGHNPELTEFTNYLIDEHIEKLPTLGVVAVNFDIESWEELDENKGKIDFFIYPKQFKYYLPKQIRTTWDKREE